MKLIPTHMRSRDAARRAFTLIELLVVVTIIGLLAALLLPVFGKVKLKARNVGCLSQLRQLGMAARLYADDNNETLPRANPIPSTPSSPQHSLPRICDVLGPYTAKSGGGNTSAPVFRCPADTAFFFETEGSSYLWNRALNGRRIDIPGRGVGVVVTNGVARSITQASFDALPVLIDFDDFHPRPPHTGRNAVYGDGHADKFTVPAMTVE